MLHDDVHHQRQPPGLLLLGGLLENLLQRIHFEKRVQQICSSDKRRCPEEAGRLRQIWVWEQAELPWVLEISRLGQHQVWFYEGHSTKNGGTHKRHDKSSIKESRCQPQSLLFRDLRLWLYDRRGHERMAHRGQHQPMLWAIEPIPSSFDTGNGWEYIKVSYIFNSFFSKISRM